MHNILASIAHCTLLDDNVSGCYADTCVSLSMSGDGNGLGFDLHTTHQSFYFAIIIDGRDGKGSGHGPRLINYLRDKDKGLFPHNMCDSENDVYEEFVQHKIEGQVGY